MAHIEEERIASYLQDCLPPSTTKEGITAARHARSAPQFARRLERRLLCLLVRNTPSTGGGDGARDGGDGVAMALTPKRARTLFSGIPPNRLIIFDDAAQLDKHSLAYMASVGNCGKAGFLEPMPPPPPPPPPSQ